MLIVSGNSFAPDEWNHHTARLWIELATGVDEVHVFARARDQRFHRAVHDNITLHLIPRGPARMATFVLTSWWLPAVVARVRPTHLVAQSPVHGGLATVVCGWVFRLPVQVELHGDQYLRSGYWGSKAHRLFFRPLARPALAGATRIRSVSPQMTKEITEVYGSRAAAKVVEVSYRVDLKTFSPPKADYKASEELAVVSVGPLHPRKNQLALVRDLATQGRPCRLTLVGRGPEEQALRAEASRLGLPLEIRGGLTHPELAELLREQDVYVHYSHSEALPRAILEAMAMGLPVIVTPVGFLRGIIEPGLTGLFLDRAGARELGKSLDQLGEEEVRDRIGRAARRRIEEHHEWKRVFDAYRSMIITMRRG